MLFLIKLIFPMSEVPENVLHKICFGKSNFFFYFTDGKPTFSTILNKSESAHRY